MKGLIIGLQRGSVQVSRVVTKSPLGKKRVTGTGSRVQKRADRDRNISLDDFERGLGCPIRTV